MMRLERSSSSTGTIVNAASTTAQSPAVPRVTPARATTTTTRFTPRVRGIILRQILLQLFLLIMTAFVLFPVLWIISMAVDPRGVTRPTDLNLIPPNANFDAFYRILTEQFTNTLDVYFGEMMVNSLFIALGTSIFTVVLGSSAAYAFSRFRFIGRQAGMLGFIVLLLLPATGTLIPLYVLFNSVAINNTLANFFPSLFTAGLFAGIILGIYFLIARFGTYNRDRFFNPSPPVLVAMSAGIALIAISLVMVIMFQRSTIYSDVIEQPVREIRQTFVDAQADFNQRQQSVAQRETTAENRERDALLVVAAVDSFNAVAGEAGSGDSSALAARLDPVITDLRAGGVDDDDAPLEQILAAQTALTNGESIDEFVTVAQEEAEDARGDAESARAGAVEAAAALVISEQTLNAARDGVNQQAAGVLSVRDSAIVGLVPIVLLAWGGALAAAAVVWVILRVLHTVVEPRTAIAILLFAIIGALTVWLTLIALQGRIGSSGGETITLRQTLLGLSLAFASGGLPFAIWNLKGYFDTIPKELEEAALIDGAGLLGTFVRVMIPLAAPAFAIVILFSFMNGWTEFVLSWTFLGGQKESLTLAMALATMANGGNAAPPDMQKFAAMSILVSIPIIGLFFAFQRWIVGGLSIGGVKG